MDRVRKRYRQEGELALIDRRGDNGAAKVNEDYTVIQSASRYGHNHTRQDLPQGPSHKPRFVLFHPFPYLKL
ncbi:MAG: hypothetical protein ACYS9T_11090 [Planctomycetota bacterium]